MNFSISTKSESRVMIPWEHLAYPNETVQDSSGLYCARLFLLR